MSISNNVKYTKPPVVKLDPSTELSEEVILKLLENAEIQNRRYKTLMDYYLGKHDILYRQFQDASKPNNKCVNNFASYIVDVRSGYFTGLPLTYNSEDLKLVDDLSTVLKDNDAGDVTHELDKLSNIHGHAFELYWIDETGAIKFKQVPADQLIMVYSADITCKPLYAIRHYKITNIFNENSRDEYVFIYDSNLVYEYKRLFNEDTKEYNLIPVDVYPHMFDTVPVIEYVNNQERTSSIEDVITLIDSYNIAQSDSVNEVQYFNDAYLLLKNLSATNDNDIEDMKNNRVMLVDGDGDAEWLTKQINDSYIEHLKDRISRDIHKFSKTPNLVSEEFVSNLSGTAIRYKVWGLEQDTASKERKWRKSLHKRLQFILNYLNIKGIEHDIDKLEVVFNRNMPQNVTELGQMATQMAGLVSQETLLTQIPFVDNVQEELIRFNNQQEERLEMTGIFTGNTTTEIDEPKETEV